MRDPLGRAYNRTKHLPERRRMMQRWADYLDGLKNGAEVVPLLAVSAGVRCGPFEQEIPFCDREVGQKRLASAMSRGCLLL